MPADDDKDTQGARPGPGPDTEVLAALDAELGPAPPMPEFDPDGFPAGPRGDRFWRVLLAHLARRLGTDHPPHLFTLSSPAALAEHLPPGAGPRYAIAIGHHGPLPDPWDEALIGTDVDDPRVQALILVVQGTPDTRDVVDTYAAGAAAVQIAVAVTRSGRFHTVLTPSGGALPLLIGADDGGDSDTAGRHGALHLLGPRLNASLARAMGARAEPEIDLAHLVRRLSLASALRRISRISVPLPDLRERQRTLAEQACAEVWEAFVHFAPAFLPGHDRVRADLSDFGHALREMAPDQIAAAVTGPRPPAPLAAAARALRGHDWRRVSAQAVAGVLDESAEAAAWWGTGWMITILDNTIPREEHLRAWCADLCGPHATQVARAADALTGS
ncbi:hypothetical protein [Bailinhaonella thermotolerans]|uniref:Uncharacterized protein n=1 Tax=Bailinhaonella thermotolerans TaxID=1070861 RepID=A0A3A4ABN5_9ACTN|nr:hypothetical protein [Bailinhaonella thermotolerans]RJL23894.1 hypothetical protein D5H75_31130 [Bailinhaonella thermotolerans]